MTKRWMQFVGFHTVMLLRFRSIALNDCIDHTNQDSDTREDKAK